LRARGVRTIVETGAGFGAAAMTAEQTSRETAETLRARAAELRLEIADARRKIASLQGLPAPAGLPSRGRGGEVDDARALTTRPIDVAVPAAASEAIVAAIQTRLATIGWARDEGDELVWKSAGTSAGISTSATEIRLARREDGATLAVSTAMPSRRAPLLFGGAVAVMGVAMATVIAFTTRGASWGLVGAVATPALVIGPLIAALVSWRRRRMTAELDRAADLLATDVDAAASAQATTRVRVPDETERESEHGQSEVEQQTVDERARTRGVSR
jgi:hypothetical protein